MERTVYTVEDWLRGKIDFDFPDSAIEAVLFDRMVDKSTAASDVSARDRELCYADLLMYAASSSTSTQGEYESDGGWQHQKSNKNVVDRASMREAAARIYAKWNDENADSANASRITLKSLY
nr:MAG TPA: hypothetical protein [Caudoviricetes sp.]